MGIPTKEDIINKVNEEYEITISEENVNIETAFEDAVEECEYNE